MLLEYYAFPRKSPYGSARSLTDASALASTLSSIQNNSQVIEKWVIPKPSVSDGVSESINEIPAPEPPVQPLIELRKQAQSEIRKLLRMIPRPFRGKRPWLSQELSRSAGISAESQLEADASPESSYEQSGYNPVSIHTATGNGLDVGAVVMATWHKIVSGHLHLALSVECDRLPAIVGFARQTETCKRGKYLAGLWEDSFAEDLLWRVNEPLQSRFQGRSRSYQALTLSWALVNGKVSLWADKLRDY